MMKEALHGVGLGLNMTHDLFLYQMYPDRGLVAMANSCEGQREVQLFTLLGESLTLLMAVELYSIYKFLALCNYVID